MTTASQHRALDLCAGPRVPWWRLLRVELRKVVDTRSGLWLLVAMGLLTAIVMAVQLVVVVTQDMEADYGSFIASTTYSIGVLLPVLGILVLTSEWGQRTAMVTFCLEPHRTRVLGAKLLAGVVVAVAAVGVSLLLGVVANLLYGVWNGEVSWEFGPLRAGAFLLIQSLGMLTGFALAALLLNSAAAIVAYFAYSWILPILLGLGALVDWFADIQPWVDFSAAQSPLAEAAMSGTDWAHLLVSGAFWLGIPLAVGGWRVLRAEVK